MILDQAVCYPVNTIVSYLFLIYFFLQKVVFQSAMQYNCLKGKHVNVAQRQRREWKLS